MTVQDWRDASAADVAPLYQAERERWLSELGWDTVHTWAVVEEARQAGRLPGFLLHHEGHVTGWTFFLLHGDILQIGAMTAGEARGVRLLLEQVIAAPEGTSARSVSLFLLPSSQAVGAALTRRRFKQRAHRYLTLDLEAFDPGLLGTPAGLGAPGGCRPWRASDETAVVRLMAEGYRGTASGETFAPNGHLEEWAWYVRQLLKTPACGVLRPEATFVVDAAGLSGSTTPGEVAGAVLTTAVGPRTAHIAQIVVAPGVQGRGLGRRLVCTVAARVRELGYGRLTLMVADDNPRARALYDALGFTEGPAFLYAARSMPSRVTRSVSRAVRFAVEPRSMSVTGPRATERLGPSEVLS